MQERQVAYPRAASRAQQSTHCFHMRDTDCLDKFGSPSSQQDIFGYHLALWLALSNPAAEIRMGTPG